MTAVGTHAWTRVEDAAPPGFGATLHGEWIKFWTVRSTGWSVAAMFVLGAGLTTLLRREGLDVAAHGGELRVRGLDQAAVGELVGRSGLLLHELTLVRSSLEDAFMTLTADSVEYAGASR